MPNTSIPIKQNELLELNNVPKRLRQLKPNASKAVLGTMGFYYYTKLETFDKIYGSKRIWVRNVECMNDRKEFILDPHLEKNKGYYHLFCFSNSDVESIPMWYMYAGKGGDGVRIKFPPSTIKAIILNCKVYTPNGKRLSVGDSDDKDCTIKAGWIFYRKKENYYKFNNKSYSVKNWDKVFNNDNMFIKSHHWLYEKEFRIIIQNNTNNKFEHLEIDLSDIFDKLSFMFGPEFSREQLNNTNNLKSIRIGRRFKNSELDIKMGID